MPENNRIFSRNFILVTLVAAGSFASFQFGMTVIPLYALSMGGSQWDVGLTAGMIALSSTPARLFAGRFSDRMGRRPILFIGAGFLVLTGLLYFATPNIPSLLIVRLIHGIGFGAVHTIATILIADIVPKNRWGEGQGYFTAFSLLSLAVSPALGFVLYSKLGYVSVFAVTLAITLVTLLLCFFVPETGKKEAKTPSAASGRSFLEKGALLPATILALTTWGHGVTVAFIPVFSIERHILNPGLYFTMLAVIGVVSRGFVGRLSDRYGRGFVLVPGLLAAMSGLVALHFTTNTPMLMLSGMLFGLGFSTVSPVVLALTGERVKPERRGMAMGMVSASNDLGIMAGSFMGGLIVAESGFSFIFLLAGSLLLVAVAVFLVTVRREMKSMFRLSAARE